MGNFKNKINFPLLVPTEFIYLENQPSYNQSNQIEETQNFRQRNSSNSNSTCSNDGDSPIQMAINNYGREFNTADQQQLSLHNRLATRNLTNIGNLSPIHDFEMHSTLSSYMLGSPLHHGRIGYFFLVLKNYQKILNNLIFCY